MKTKISLAFLALASGAFTQVRTFEVETGDKIVVLGRAEADRTVDKVFTRIDVKDVIRALEILEKFAPSKDGQSPIVRTSGSGTFTSVSWATHTPTKADEAREEAQNLKRRAAEKMEEADRLEKEQQDIAWARGVLAKWKAKLADLTP